MRFFLTIGLLLFLCACGRIDEVGRAPEFTPIQESNEFTAMMTQPFPVSLEPTTPIDTASLWSGSRGSLLGDRRAVQQGDILTVVIEIDERAEISNSSSRSRNGSTSLGIPQFFGIPQRVDPLLAPGASLGNAVSADSNSSSGGDGSVRRNERLTLRIAATVTQVLQNGVLRIDGRQEVRVNFEIRELLVSGYVRPADISRQNEITYDKIAGARISYGGRGQITDVQQPRYGQQIADMILPF
jgi:flagellar L-ring protein precursor FlgH